MAEAHRQIGCPRCGYDLRGHTLNWNESCPLGGTCPECGLVFEWVRVMRPELGDWPALVEHAPAGVRSVFAAAWRTWAWTTTHVGFWRRLRLDHRVKLGRLALWPVLLLVPMHLAASLAGVVLYGQVITAKFAAPAVKITGLDVLSCFTYPFGIFAAAPYVTLSMYESGFTGRLMPTGVWMRPLVERWPWWVPTSLGVHGAYMLLMLVLPTTRRLAKVRPAHVARAFIYGLWWLVPLAAIRLIRNLVLTAGIAVGALTPATVRITRMQSDSLPLLGFGLIVSTAFWWWLAMRRGWSLPQPRVAWALLTTAALLAGAVVFALLSPMWMFAR